MTMHQMNIFDRTGHTQVILQRHDQPPTSCGISISLPARELHDFYRQEERRQRAELARHAEPAMARSRELLLEHLTPAQRETFERNKWFVIEGGKSRRRYRIRAAVHMVANIDVIAVRDDGSEVVSHRLCAHCRLDEVPLFDQLLAQKLMLEFDEERFLSLANHHRAAA